MKSGAGLYTGLAGVGLAFRETHRATGDAKYRTAFQQCQRTLLAAAETDDEGLHWNSSTDVISGTAGVGLYLLQVHQFDDETYP